MSRFALIAIGYNRPDSMNRLLASLAIANYSEEVDLIISIDNSGTDSVARVAHNFQWQFGQKIINEEQNRLGLRNHILKCGDFLNKYEAVAVFEDDIVASPAFFSYMVQTVEKYAEDDRIAGISLYTHLWNVNVSYPFVPAPSRYDVFAMQFAQSWGQIWMKNQWMEFKKWYLENSEKIHPQANIPEFVTRWSDKSWLKYHIKYCIDNNKYFIYPYHSYTTCFEEPGEHAVYQEDTLQVPMATDISELRLPDNFLNTVRYDAFFEREDCIGSWIGISEDELTIDCYGSKTNLIQDKRYLLSSRVLDYRIIKTFGLRMRPMEANVQFSVNGDNLFLYDTACNEQNRKVYDNVAMYIYQMRVHSHAKDITAYVLEKAKSNILRKIVSKKRK